MQAEFEEMREILKEEVKEEIKHDIKMEIIEERKKLKEAGEEDKEILRRMKLCFAAEKMVSKSTQTSEPDLDSDQESVSLLGVAKEQLFF